MLSRTTQTARAATRQARRYATALDAGGVRVASMEPNAPTASLTLLLKAGTRYETKAGQANALKHFAFKSTAKRSTLGTVRETELYGGVLSSTLTREHLAITAEFLKGDEAFFLDVLTSFATSSKFARYEFEEYVMPAVESESQNASTDSATLALEAAHKIAFRSGLGNSLFAPSHAPVNVTDIQSFAQGAFSSGNAALLATGLEAEALSKLLGDKLKNLSSGSGLKSEKTAVHGGETRLPGHGAPTVFIGFAHAGESSAALAALASHLEPVSAVKWGSGVSPLSEQLPKNTSIKPVYLPYSDAGLFGVLVQGANEGVVLDAAKVAVKVLQGVAKEGVSGELAGRAAAQAKFAAAKAIESRTGYAAVLGPKVLEGSSAHAKDVISAFESVDAKAIQAAAQGLLKSKPIFVGVGDVDALPFADEVGL